MKLISITLRRVGVDSARFDDVHLDLRAGDLPADTLLWLRNGGGKSSLLALMLAVLLPRRVDFLGGRGGRALADYVADGDTSHVILRWRTQQGTTLTTALMCEWPNRTRTPDISRLRRLWWLSTNDQLPPLETTADGSRQIEPVRFPEFLLSLRAQPGVTVSDKAGDWTALLAGHGFDTPLLRFLRDANRTEGGLGELFTAADAGAFVDFAVDVLTEPDRAAALASTVRDVAGHLAARPVHLAARDLTASAAAALQSVSDSVRAVGAAHHTHHQEERSAGALSAALSAAAVTPDQATDDLASARDRAQQASAQVLETILQILDSNAPDVALATQALANPHDDELTRAWQGAGQDLVAALNALSLSPAGDLFGDALEAAVRAELAAPGGPELSVTVNAWRADVRAARSQLAAPTLERNLLGVLAALQTAGIPATAGWEALRGSPALAQALTADTLSVDTALSMAALAAAGVRVPGSLLTQAAAVVRDLHLDRPLALAANDDGPSPQRFVVVGADPSVVSVTAAQSAGALDDARDALERVHQRCVALSVGQRAVAAVQVAAPTLLRLPGTDDVSGWEGLARLAQGTHGSAAVTLGAAVRALSGVEPPAGAPAISRVLLLERAQIALGALQVSVTEVADAQRQRAAALAQAAGGRQQQLRLTDALQDLQCDARTQEIAAAGMPDPFDVPVPLPDGDARDQVEAAVSALRASHAGCRLAQNRLTAALARVRAVASGRDGDLVAAQLATIDDQSLVTSVQDWDRTLRIRLKQLDALVDELDADAARAATVIAADVSELVAELMALAGTSGAGPGPGAAWLRFGLRRPAEAPGATARLAAALPALAVRADEPLILLRRALRVAYPSGFTVALRKPGISGDDRWIDASALGAFSGGERLTTVVLLYCALIAVRRRRAGADLVAVLLLDNPVGSDSHEALLRAQRDAARAAGVQLVFTTGVADQAAVAAFDLLIRMRNRPALSGRLAVDIDGREPTVVQAAHVHRVPGT